MHRLIFWTGAAALCALAARAQTASPLSPEAQAQLLRQYCATCHNDRSKTGGMTLTLLDPAHPEQNAELAEKVIRKLRAGMMPPSGMPRPDAATLKNLAASVEFRIDQAAA